ncbi:MAG: FmdE family protein [Thermoproteus sp.]
MEAGCDALKVARTFREIGRRLYELIEEEIGDLGPSNAFIATNAKFLIFRGYSASPIVDAFIEKGLDIYYNVVPVHAPYYADLQILAYNKDRGLGVFVEAPREALDDAVCKGGTFREERLRREAFSPGQTSGGWDVKAGLASVLAAWLAGAPHELLLGAELHNHVCPGLISGAMILRRLEKLGVVKPGARLSVISAPPWCKDDALIQLLDATPGKRSFVVKFLPQERREELRRKLGGDPAYIVFINEGGRSEALVVTFDWDKARELSGVGHDTPEARRAMSVSLLKYLDAPELFVGVSRRAEVDGSLFDKLSLAGVDPYELLRDM